MTGRGRRGRERVKKDEPQPPDPYQLSNSSDTEADEQTKPRNRRRREPVEKKTDTDIERLNKILIDCGLPADELASMSPQEKLSLVNTLQMSKENSDEVPLKQTTQSTSAGVGDLWKYVHESSEEETTEATTQRRKSPRRSPMKTEINENIPLRQRLAMQASAKGALNVEEDVPNENKTKRKSSRGSKTDGSLSGEVPTGIPGGKPEPVIDAAAEEKIGKGKAQTRGRGRGRGRGKRTQKEEDDDVGSDTSHSSSRRGRNKTTVGRVARTTRKKEEKPPDGRNITEFFSKDRSSSLDHDTRPDEENNEKDDLKDMDDFEEERRTSIFPNTQDKLRFQSSSMMSTPGEPPEILEFSAEVHTTPTSITRKITDSARRLLGSVKSFVTGGSPVAMGQIVTPGEEVEDSDDSVVFESQPSQIKAASTIDKINKGGVSQRSGSKPASRDSSPELFVSEAAQTQRADGDGAYDGETQPMDIGDEATNQVSAESQTMSTLRLSVTGDSPELRQEAAPEDMTHSNSEPRSTEGSQTTKRKLPLDDEDTQPAKRRPIMFDFEMDVLAGDEPPPPCSQPTKLINKWRKRHKFCENGTKLYAMDKEDVRMCSRRIVGYFEQYRVLLREAQLHQPEMLPWGHPVVVGPPCRYVVDGQMVEAGDVVLPVVLTRSGRVSRPMHQYIPVMPRPRANASGSAHGVRKNLGQDQSRGIKLIPAPGTEPGRFYGNKQQQGVFKPKLDVIIGKTMGKQSASNNIPVLVQDTQQESDDDFVAVPKRRKKRQSHSFNASEDFVPDTQDFGGDEDNATQFDVSRVPESPEVKTPKPSTLRYLPTGHSTPVTNQAPVYVTPIRSAVKGHGRRLSATKNSQSGTSVDEKIVIPCHVPKMFRDDTGQDTSGSPYDDMFAKSEKRTRRKLTQTVKANVAKDVVLIDGLSQEEEDPIKEPVKFCKNVSINRTAKGKNVDSSSDSGDDLTVIEVQSKNDTRSKQTETKVTSTQRKNSNNMNKDLEFDVENPIPQNNIQRVPRSRVTRAGGRGEVDPADVVLNIVPQAEPGPSKLPLGGRAAAKRRRVLPPADDRTSDNEGAQQQKKSKTVVEDDMVNCPMCYKYFTVAAIVNHADTCTGNLDNQPGAHSNHIPSNHGNQGSGDRARSQIKVMPARDGHSPIVIRGAAGQQPLKQYGRRVPLQTSAEAFDLIIEPVSAEDSGDDWKPGKEDIRTAQEEENNLEELISDEEESSTDARPKRSCAKTDERQPNKGQGQILGQGQGQKLGLQHQKVTDRAARGQTGSGQPSQGQNVQGQIIQGRKAQGQGRIQDLREEIQPDILESPVQSGPTELCPMCNKLVPAVTFQEHVPQCVDSAELTSALHTLDPEPDVPMLRRRLQRPPLRGDAVVHNDIIEGFDENQTVGRRRH